MRIRTILTAFGSLHLVLERDLPKDVLLHVNFSNVGLVSLDIPGKPGLIFRETLAKRVTVDEEQIVAEIVQGNAQEPMHVENVQEPVVTVPDPQSVAVTGWPESLDKEIVLLVAAEWSPEDVRACKSDPRLEALKGIGKASVKKIRAAFAEAK